MTNIIKEGWLIKKSRHFGKKRKRWIVLTRFSLSTFKKKRVYRDATEKISVSSISHIIAGKNSFTVKLRNGLLFELTQVNEINNENGNKYFELLTWIKTIETIINDRQYNIKYKQYAFHSMLSTAGQQIINKGYAKLDMFTIGYTYNHLIYGYCRNYKCINVNTIIDIIEEYSLCVNIFCWNNDYFLLKSGIDDDHEYNIFIISKEYCILSTLLTNMTNKLEFIAFNNIRSNILEYIMIYLSHHKGKQHDDKWDQSWISSFDEKVISEIMYSAKQMEITSLASNKIEGAVTKQNEK
eukprot:487826_1